MIGTINFPLTGMDVLSGVLQQLSRQTEAMWGAYRRAVEWPMRLAAEVRKRMSFMAEGILQQVAVAQTSIMAAIIPVVMFNWNLHHPAIRALTAISQELHEISRLVRVKLIELFSVDEEDLDRRLADLNKDYPSMRRAAWKMYQDKPTPDYARHAASSMRELYNKARIKIGGTYAGAKQKLQGPPETVQLAYLANEGAYIPLNIQIHADIAGEVIDLEMAMLKAQFVLYMMLNPNALAHLEMHN